MWFKRLILRYKLSIQKYWIKAKNVGVQDLYSMYRVVSGRLPHIVHLREMILIGLVFATVVFFMFLSSFREMNGFYLVTKPDKGGSYTAGMVGKFLRINPIYSKTNPGDEVAVNLVFSGLMKRGDDGRLVGDLAKEWQVQDKDRVFIFKMKNGVKWHDGADFSADDVIFTIGLIQNPDVRSPLYETWKGVRAEKTIDDGVKLILEKSNNSFLENTTVKIVPKHLLVGIPISSIQTAEFNVKPIGTGPYEFVNLNKDSDRETLMLAANKGYYGGEPNIESVVLEGYAAEGDVLDAYERRHIKAIDNPSPSLVQQLSYESTTKLHEYHLPRYVATFFNTERRELKDKNFRMALALTVDRNEIVRDAIYGRGTESFSPIPFGVEGFLPKFARHTRDLNKARKILKDNGYEEKGGILSKKGQGVSLGIVTGDTPELQKTADIVAADFRQLGAKVEVTSIDSGTLERDYIRPRDYDVLIFGEDLGMSNDLFSFWHSTQINDPGLNFSKFKDRELDKYLELVRYTTNSKDRVSQLKRVQDIIVGNAAAVYLYDPFYYLVASEKVGGIEDGNIVSPSEVFHNVKDWYVNARQVIIGD